MVTTFSGLMLTGSGVDADGFTHAFFDDFFVPFFDHAADVEEVDDPPDEADDDEPEDPEDGIPRGAVEVEVVDGANDPEDVGEGLLFLPVRIKCQSAVALFFG